MRLYTLPNGRATTSSARYVREWRRLGNRVAKVLGLRLAGFDPDLLLQQMADDRKTILRGYTMPLWMAQKIADACGPVARNEPTRER